jgi:hypothetical protein
LIATRLQYPLFLFKGIFYRPETVGEGNHRFFTSDNFRNADPSLTERISKDLNTAAIKNAGRSFPEGRLHKKARTNTVRENSAMAVEEVPSRAEGIPSLDAMTAQTSRGPDMVGSTHGRAAPNASVADTVQLKQFPLEKSVVASFVDLLK